MSFYGFFFFLASLCNIQQVINIYFPKLPAHNVIVHQFACSHHYLYSYCYSDPSRCVRPFILERHFTQHNWFFTTDTIFISTCERIPSLLRIFVSEGQDVWRSSAAITHHHRDGRCVPEVLQHNWDHIRASFNDESHHWHTLTNACTRKQAGSSRHRGCSVIVERKTGMNNRVRNVKKEKGSKG